MNPNPPLDSDDATRRQLDRLKDQIEKTPEAARARLHNQAGDLHARLGEDAEALREYGKAIDLYIDGEQIHLATATCAKVIRRSPRVTRAHFTQACLALYLGHRIEAIKSIEQYASAGQRSDTLNMVVPRLRFLARRLTDVEVREHIARQLERIGDAVGARFIRENPPPQAKGLIDPARASLLLEAATRDSNAVWAEFWLK